ncbi:MAG: WG repeat-containing protein [Oscillospiraceae bacterium]|jgi:hypothetical protein|nr:WG repeat-containing protein [Oscillospiraceae bacterium]
MKQRIFTFLLVLAICSTLAPYAFAAGDERGVMSYEQIIEPQYEDAKPFSEKLAAVKKGGKWGYIDIDNKVVVPFEYDMANPFSESLAIVGKYGTFSFERWDYETDGYVTEDYSAIYIGRIDRSGNYKPFRAYLYDWTTGQSGISDYYVPVDGFDMNQKYVYYGGWAYVGSLFDTKGEQFKTADEFTSPLQVPTEGLVPAWEEGVEGCCYYLDMKGNISIDLSGKHVFYDGDLFQLQDENDAIFEGYVCYAYPFNQGMAAVWECLIQLETGYRLYRAGFINRSGDWVIEPQFDTYFWNGVNKYQVFMDAGLASVAKNETFGAIDKSGNAVIPFEYNELWPFIEGLAIFNQNGMYGYIDVSGNVAIKAEYAAASNFSGGFAVAYDGSTAFLIDRHGKTIPGSEEIDYNNFFKLLYDGGIVINAPDEIFIISYGDKYGFGKVYYKPPFPDSSEVDDWAYEEVIAAIKEGLVPAKIQNMYRDNITRADYSSLVVNAVCSILGKERDELVLEVSKKSMSDWVQEYPFTDAADSEIVAAYALGLVTGYTDGTFKPYSQIRRQEAAVLLWRAAGLLGMDNSAPPKSGFSDRDKVPDWAIKQVDYVSSIGVMVGIDGNIFSPTGFYTHQQSFVTIWRTLQAMRG